MREVGLERAIVYRNARHIVRPERMLLPIVVGGSLGKLTTSLALWVYDWLAAVPRPERRKMLDAATTLEREPLLKKEGLKGGGIYYEYRTDDARLTIEVAKTAHSYGAFLVNYAAAETLCYDSAGKICGATVRDTLTDTLYTVQATQVINAAGPWVDDVRGKEPTPITPITGKRLHLTKGVHVVVDYARLPLQQSAYFDAPTDGRMLFAIPRGEVVYLGTTDTDYKGDTANPLATANDVAYILAATNAVFPSAALTAADVQSSWTGLRPLVYQEGKAAGEISRRDEVFVSASGLISIAGGKLTGYRKMAERAVDTALKALVRAGKAEFVRSSTAKRILSGGDFESEAELETMLKRRTGEVREVEIPARVLREWLFRYGSNMDEVIALVYDLFTTIPDPKTRWETAEIKYAIEQEMATTLADFLTRRTGSLYFNRPATAQTFERTAHIMATLLNWDEARTYREMATFKREMDAVMTFG